MTQPAGLIDVCLSVDVEFGINGALTNPNRQPLGIDWVYGRSATGRDEGLGFLLDCLDRHGLKATCFTEALQPFLWRRTDAQGRR